MLTTQLRINLSLFNFFSILCLKYEKKVFNISKIHSILNLVKLPLALALTFALSISAEFRKEVTRDEIVILENFSVFSIVLMVILSVLVDLTALLICFTQWLNRREIERIFNRASRFLKFLDNNQVAEFRIKILKINFVLFILSAWFILLQNSVLNLTWKALVSGLLIVYPFFVIINFWILLKFSELFFITCLRNYDRKVKIMLNNQSCVSENSETLLLIEHHDLYSLSQQFNKVFGTQITIVTCCVSLMTTLDVNITSLDTKSDGCSI